MCFWGVWECDVFCSEINQDNIFLFIKNYFWYQQTLKKNYLKQGKKIKKLIFFKIFLKHKNKLWRRK